MLNFGRFVMAALLALSLAATAASAAPLDDAKAAGQIGERPDGYVGLVAGDPGGNLGGLVTDINNQRRAKYEEIAKKRGAPVEAVAQLAGGKLIEKTPGGQYVMGADGQWRQK